MRPHVHVNCAITLDGCMGGPGRTPLKISGPEDLHRVHELRAASDAILVGVGTVLADDPKLTVKWDLLGRTGPQPLRVVLDSALRTPADAQVRNDAAPTLFFAAPGTPAPAGMDVERAPRQGGALDPGAVLDGLAGRGVRRLMVEGGPRVIGSFLAAGLVDQMTVFIGPQVVADATAPRFADRALDIRTSLRLTSAAPLGGGILASWRRT